MFYVLLLKFENLFICLLGLEMLSGDLVLVELVCFFCGMDCGEV